MQFKTPEVNVNYPAAGITGGPIAEHKHIHHSDNQTALSDPSVKSLQDAIKQTILEVVSVSLSVSLLVSLSVSFLVSHSVFLLVSLFPLVSLSL